MTSELTLEVCYYNEQLAVWEPLIEPVEAEMRRRPWQISVEVNSFRLCFGEHYICVRLSCKITSEMM